jgi:4-amino-4-deoxy-L-arabinose transferase-like glycosyltransferase
LETIMSMRQRVMAVLWLIGAAAALTLSTLWAIAASNGKVSAWALVAFVWSAALLAGLAHHLTQPDQLDRYRSRRKPLAGPRPGAELPG